MFKVGDKVVCIDDTIGFLLDEDLNVKVNKVYLVSFVTNKGEFISFDGFVDVFSSKSFILLSEYRKKKIKNICSKLEIK